MIPQAAKAEDLPLIEKLSNDVFRSNPADGKTMFAEFPDLFSVDNLENIRIIKVDDIPVSNISYTVRNVRISSSVISAASLGAVCTYEEHRGKGYATMLLNDCMENMRKQGVDVLIISGDRRMYTNAGSRHCGVSYRFNVNRKIDGSDKNITLTELSPENYPLIAKIYAGENVRFERSYDEFVKLLDSRKFLRKTTDVRKIIGINYLGELCGYMCLTVNDRKGFVHDCAGDGNLLVEAVIKIVNSGIADDISARLLPRHNGALKTLEKRGIGYTRDFLNGTFVMMNFEDLMEKLKPYFYQITSSSLLDKVRFLNTEKGYCIKFGQARYETDDPQEILNLVFGEGKTGFKELDEAIFPVPFPDPFSLNYI